MALVIIDLFGESEPVVASKPPEPPDREREPVPLLPQPQTQLVEHTDVRPIRRPRERRRPRAN